jgi:hypothetical protein
MRLIASLAVLLAIATPANARFYNYWRCGEVALELVSEKQWYRERDENGELGKMVYPPPLWSVSLEGLKNRTMLRGFNFKLTDDGPYLNGRLCETMQDEEWEKLHNGWPQFDGYPIPLPRPRPLEAK